MRLRGRFVGVGATFVALASCLLAPAAGAAEGQLDPSFAANGTFSQPYGFGSYPPSSMPFAVAEQSNGDIVLAGESGNTSGESDLLVVRLTPSGSPDPSFGNAGEVDLNLPQPSPGRDSVAYSLAIQPDGKLVIGADTYVGYQEAAIVRLMPDGALDTSFGSGGIAQIVDLTARGVALTPGGDIVVGGWWQDDKTFKAVALAELSADGQPVMSFGSNGVEVDQLDSSSNPQSFAQGVAVNGAGQIYAVANAGGNGRLARFTPSGSPDPSFGNGGAVALASDGEALALESDGTPLTVGAGANSFAGSTARALVVQHFLATGAPDPGFGTGGAATLPGTIGCCFDERSDSIAVRPDGQVLAANSENPYGQGPSTVWLLTHSGQPDSGFGSGGQLALRGDMVALASQADDKALIGGGAPSGQAVYFTVYRLLGPASSSSSSGGTAGPGSGNSPSGGGGWAAVSRSGAIAAARISCASRRIAQGRRRRVHCAIDLRVRRRTKVWVRLIGKPSLRATAARVVKRGPRTINLWFTLPGGRKQFRATVLLSAGSRHAVVWRRRITVR